MRNLDCLSAEQILAIDAPELLFSRSTQESKREYCALALRWHPDLQNEAASHNVFIHIASLYREALNKQAKGTWFEPAEKIEEQEKGVKKFRLKNGLLKAVEYYTSRPFELGHFYVGEHSVCYEITNEYSYLFHNGKRHIARLHFKDEAMAVEMSTYLPQIEDKFETEQNTNVVQIRKTPDQLLLADILAFYAQRLEPVEHLGWILNVVWNIACYLQWVGVTHNAISAENLFISPIRHSGMLLGGWWYATSAGTALSALPDRTLKLMPLDILDSRVAEHRSDHELIKALGRELLGDASGARLIADASIPKAISSWLRMPADRQAINNYREWKYDVLEESFGAPSFIPMNLTRKNIYKEI